MRPPALLSLASMDGAAGPVGQSRRARRLMAALWPSFLMAGVLEGLLFSLLDPAVLAGPAGLSATAVYSLAFLCFWAVTALTSGLSLLLAGE